jgi:hypothetical protein
MASPFWQPIQHNRRSRFRADGESSSRPPVIFITGPDVKQPGSFGRFGQPQAGSCPSICVSPLPRCRLAHRGEVSLLPLVIPRVVSPVSTHETGSATAFEAPREIINAA